MLRAIILALLLAPFLILVVCTGGLALALLARSDPTMPSAVGGAVEGMGSRPRRA